MKSGKLNFLKLPGPLQACNGTPFTNIPPIMIINRIYEHQNLLSLWLVSFLVGLRTYQNPCSSIFNKPAKSLATCYLTQLQHPYYSPIFSDNHAYCQNRYRSLAVVGYDQLLVLIMDNGTGRTLYRTGGVGVEKKNVGRLHPQSPRHFVRQPSVRVSQTLRPLLPQSRDRSYLLNQTNTLRVHRSDCRNMAAYAHTTPRTVPTSKEDR
jgi:hypothetical protein